MKAELFVHAGSQQAAPSLRRLVAEHIDPEVPVEVHNIDAGTLRENLAIGTRYSQLLQAAIPPDLGLSLDVSSLDWLGSRVYIRVYWPVFVGSFYSNAAVGFFPHQFGSFFPALAVRDRMVLVPAGQGEALGNVYPGDVPVGPVLRSDVLEVDYADEAAVTAALAAVAGSISAQLQQELAAWGSFQPPGSFDVRAAARDLDVDLAHLRRILARQVDSVRMPYQALSARLNVTELPHGRWTRVLLTVTNSSGTALPGVTVQVTGPAEVLPARVEVDLPAAGEVAVPLSMKPVDEGEFPLEVTLVRPEDAPFSSWLPPSHLWVTSVGAG